MIIQCKIFQDSPCDFPSPTYGHIRSVLFNFQEFGIFYLSRFFFFFLDFDLIPLWSEFCFIFQHLIYVGSTGCAPEKNVYPSC